MAKKGVLNLEISSSYNILEKIIENGKIPVIRASNKGFQNYKQDNYFNRYKDEECLMYWSCSKSNEKILKGAKPEKGCFVILGGVQSASVIGAHEGEKVHIGYIEPDTKVFITYVSKNSKLEPFSYVTAKERYEDSLRYFNEIKNKKDFDFDNFDVLSEAIVDSKDIYKVTVVNDEKLLFNTLKNDSFLKIIPEEVLFYRFVYNNATLDSDFLKSIDRERILKLSFLRSWNNEFNFFEMIDSDCLYRKLLYKSFKKFFLNKSLDVSIHNYLNDLESLDKIYSKNSLLKISRIFFNPDLNCVSFRTSLKKSYFGKKDDFFGFFNGEIILNKEGEKITFTYCDSDSNLKNISLKDLLKPSFRNYLFNLLDCYNEYTKIISKYTNFVESDFLNFLKIFRDTDRFLNKYNYDLNLSDYTYKIFFSDTFILEYNFILNDFVLELGNKFYNIETLPNDKDLYNFINHFKTYFESKFSNLNKEFILN